MRELIKKYVRWYLTWVPPNRMYNDYSWVIRTWLALTQRRKYEQSLKINRNVDGMLKKFNTSLNRYLLLNGMSQNQL